MAQITKNLDQVEVWDDWYEDMLDQFVEEAKEKGIEIKQERFYRHQYQYRPAISFSGFWSQGDGLAFDADINWPTFFDAHPQYKIDLLEWYLLLSANPDHTVGSINRTGRNYTTMVSDVDVGYVTPIKNGFFAGLEDDELPEMDRQDLDSAVQTVCEDEADRMYAALEAEYEFQLEDAKERAIEDLIEEHKEPIFRMLWPMMTGGEVEEDEIDLDDLENLGLIDRNGVTKKGLKVLA